VLASLVYMMHDLISCQIQISPPTVPRVVLREPWDGHTRVPGSHESRINFRAISLFGPSHSSPFPIFHAEQHSHT
jgi:hypothetical protein